MSAFDLTLFPMTIESGREQYMLPGLLALGAPRKAARLRAQDMLLLYLRVGGGAGKPAPFTNAQQKEIVSKLADTYFNSPGSVTAGLRAAAGRLNDFMLNRNLKSGHEGQLTGSLTLAVAHAGILTIAHAGPTHSYFLSKSQAQHFDDGQGLRGLGLGRQLPARFYQVNLEPGDMLILCPAPPESWNKALVGSQQLSFEAVRRRLVSGAGVDLQVGVARFTAGKGLVNYWRPTERQVRQEGQAQEPSSAAPLTPEAESALPKAEAALPKAEAALPTVDRPSRTPPAEKTGRAQRKPEPGGPGILGRLKSMLSMDKQTAPTQAGERRVSLADTQRRLDSAVDKIQPAVEKTQPEAGESQPAAGVLPGELEVRPGAVEVHPVDLAFDQAADKIQPAADHDYQADAQADGLEDHLPAPGQPANHQPEPLPDTQVSFGVPQTEPRPGQADSDPSKSGLPVVFLKGEENRQASIPPAARPRRPEAAAAQPTGRAVVDRDPVSGRRIPASARPAAGPTIAGKRETERGAPRPPKPQPVPGSGGPPVGDRLRAWLAPKWGTTRAGANRLGRSAAAAAAKAMPKRSGLPAQPREPLINLSPSWMLMIAILVPVLMVAAATTVYFRAGRAEQFSILLDQAQQYAAQASQQTDPALLKQGWTTTYDLVIQAEQYGTSEVSTSLKQQAVKALDALQGVVRLEFQSATTSMYSSEVNITRMVATLNQVFMLDSSTGSIRSMTRITTGGFEPNFNFNCSPQKAGAMIVGPMIDLATIPINNELNAEIMGIDAGGNLVYCAANKPGIESLPLQLPDMGWGKITAITTYGDSLYVLDPPANAVYRYDGMKGLYENKPHLYFDNDIPNLTDVVDMAIDQEFLYLLHADGKMTVCSSGGVNYGITRCTDPSPYGDSRDGHELAPLVFPGTRFTLIQTTEPPDPSLFAMDVANRSIYHLSQRRLNFQREYRETLNGDYSFPNRAPTAFAITPNRRVLIAFANQIFYATLP